MQDAVLIVAIVATSVTPVAIVAIVFGRFFRATARTRGKKVELEIGKEGGTTPDRNAITEPAASVDLVVCEPRVQEARPSSSEASSKTQLGVVG